MCNIWRKKTPKTKRFTFRQNHLPGLTQRRLDYFYISNSMQIFIENTDALASLPTDALASFPTDQSPITFSYCKREESNRGRSFWKFNNSLIEKEERVHEMKKINSDTLNELFI